jgi:hypothetical protein
MPDVLGDNLGRQKFKRFLVRILPVFIAVVQSAEGDFPYDMDPTVHKKMYIFPTILNGQQA